MTAAEHWHFLEWTGALEGMENPAEVAVEGDLTASAVFTGDLHSITVEAVSAHQDLTLPVECLLMLTAAAESLYDGPAASVSLEDVPYGADFTVEAEAAEGWRLREWTGNGDFSGGDPVLGGTVYRDLSGTAVFARRHTLSIELAPASEVMVDVCGPALLAPDAVTELDAVEGRELHEYVVDRETVLFLDPHPVSPGWRFMAWSGTDAASVSGGGELEMDGDKSIEAVFARDWALVLGENITADPGPDGNGRYLDGAEVTLTAAPPEGHHFPACHPHMRVRLNGVTCVVVVGMVPPCQGMATVPFSTRLRTFCGSRS